MPADDHVSLGNWTDHQVDRSGEIPRNSKAKYDVFRPSKTTLMCETNGWDKRHEGCDVRKKGGDVACQQERRANIGGGTPLRTLRASRSASADHLGKCQREKARCPGVRLMCCSVSNSCDVAHRVAHAQVHPCARIFCDLRMNESSAAIETFRAASMQRPKPHKWLKARVSPRRPCASLRADPRRDRETVRSKG